MDYYLEEACEFVERRVMPEFEEAWESVVNREPPEYNVLVWGSTVREDREPTDLNIIIEYSGDFIGDDEKAPSRVSSRVAYRHRCSNI